MGLLATIKAKFGSGDKVTVVWSREHHLEQFACVIDHQLNLVRSSANQSWPKPDFDPKPLGNERIYLAMGEKIVPWPTREKPAYDVMDDGTRIEITPERIDEVVENAHKLGRLAAAGETSLGQLLLHLGAGAFIGLVLAFFLMKFLGFTIAHDTTGTSVTITNATTNSTSLPPGAAEALLVPLAVPLHAARHAIRGLWTKEGEDA